MKSIQTKIISLIMMAVVLCSGVIGGIGVWHIKNVSEQNSAQIMNLRCREEGKKIEHIFHSIEQSVKIIEKNSVLTQDMTIVLRSEVLRKRLIESLEPILLASANSTEGAVAVYVHFNPEIAPSDSGLFYSKSLVKESFHVQKVTDLNELSPEEKEDADWYYRAVEAGEPVWLEPYNNGKIEDDVISYVVPVYQKKLLIGIVGMDILLSDITEEIASIEVYENGAACLLNEQDDVLYHSNGKPQYEIRNVGVWEEFRENTAHDVEGKYTFEYYSNGSSCLLELP